MEWAGLGRRARSWEGAGLGESAQRSQGLELGGSQVRQLDRRMRHLLGVCRLWEIERPACKQEFTEPNVTHKKRNTKIDAAYIYTTRTAGAWVQCLIKVTA